MQKITGHKEAPFGHRNLTPDQLIEMLQEYLSYDPDTMSSITIYKRYDEEDGWQMYGSIIKVMSIGAIS
jgi:hypothetical protein